MLSTQCIWVSFYFIKTHPCPGNRDLPSLFEREGKGHLRWSGRVLMKGPQLFTLGTYKPIFRFLSNPKNSPPFTENGKTWGTLNTEGYYSPQNAL
jgi:hypothetical protein